MFRLYTRIMMLYSHLSGQPPQITPAQAWELTEGHRYIDTSKTLNELSLAARSPKETIQATVEWLQTHPISGEHARRKEHA